MVVCQLPKPNGLSTGAMMPAVEVLQAPDGYGGEEDDGECLLQEVLALVPEQVDDVLSARPSVVGQFHDEGHSLALEGKRLGKERHDDSHHYAYQIQSHHHKPCLVAEEGFGNEAEDGNLGCATHEGG